MTLKGKKYKKATAMRMDSVSSNAIMFRPERATLCQSRATPWETNRAAPLDNSVKDLKQ